MRLPPRPRRPLPQARLPLLVALLALLLGLSLAPPPARATGSTGLPLPAPAGSQWRIIAGYNSTTHVGDDPHALDLVRTDAATAGTTVLAPVDGAITYLAGDCLTIADGFGMAHLLCHVWAQQDLVRGQVVQAGQPIATVAPDGYAGNGGLAHIHYAVHRSLGGGRLSETVPFSGRYALEGRDLLLSGAYNEHAGLTFVSTNPFDAADRAADYLPAGWNLAGWTSAARVQDATAGIRAQIGSLLIFDAQAQRFRLYSPALPAALNGFTTLAPGDALWVSVTDPAGLYWPRPVVTTASDIPLYPGFNLVTWTGPRRDIAAAVAPLAATLLSIHAFDPETRQYRTYRPAAPPFLSDLAVLQPGQALWVAVAGEVLWTQR